MTGLIKNKSALSQKFPRAQILLDLSEVILKSLDPYLLVRKNKLWSRLKYQKFRHIYVIGAGKATLAMARAVNDCLSLKITAGYINVPQTTPHRLGRIIVNTASHPLPNQAGLKGAQTILKIAHQAQAGDLVIGLFSGGGSALLPLPNPGLTLKAKIKLTQQLLKSAATIHEINTVRKHLSQIKGGRLAQAVWPARLVCFYISDVVGDDLKVIASGPTVPDSTTIKQTRKILQKYKIQFKPIDSLTESVKKIDSYRVQNYIIGSNEIALQAAQRLARQKGYRVKIITNTLQGEARRVAPKISRQLAQQKPGTILLYGGEPTLTVKGNGYGGRNQELILASLPYLTKQTALLSLATDGCDGFTPRPVAGAIADGRWQSTDFSAYLKNNDSYTILAKMKALLRTGLTGTNVGDIILGIKY